MTQRSGTVRIDGEEFDLSLASDEAWRIIGSIKDLDKMAEERTLLYRELQLAHRARLNNLKSEVISSTTGVDLASLIDGD